jgi:hypothetical protein
MRWLAALLGLCLLGGLAASWLAFSRSDVGPPPPAADPVGLPTAEPAAEVETAGDMVAPGATDEDAAEAPADSDPAAERVDAEPAVDPTRAPRVQVVRDNPPVAVADAIVHYVTKEQAEVFLRARKQTMPRYEWPEALGQRARTGADGIVQLPATETPWLCAAAVGDEFAFTVVPPGERLVVMHLVLDETVTVHATHGEERAAAGLPIALLQRAGNNQVRPVWQGEAAANGRAVVRHFQLLLEKQSSEKGAQQPRYAALAMAPLQAPVAVEFSRPVPREPIRLVLPPIGSLEVQLTDHRGTPLLTPAVVIAQVERKEEPTQPFPFAAGFTNRRQQKPVGAEPVLLPFVGANTPLRLSARFPGDPRRAAQLSPLTGPGQADEQKHIALPLAAHHVVLAGRLLLPTRLPVAAAATPAVLWRADRDLDTYTLHTIADGRFDLVLGARSDATEYCLEVRCTPPMVITTAWAPTAAAAPPLLGARLHVPGLQGGQRIELGDIVLGEAPVLTAGVVVDDSGQPVAAASVVVQQEEPPRPGRNEQRGDPWRNLPLLATSTEQDGTFVLHGALPPGRLRVRADTNLHFADSVPLQSQGQQLRIRIDRNGILNGRVLLPDWVADGTVTLTMRPFDEQQKRNTQSVGLVRRGGGRFTVQPLAPGRYDAIVAVRNLPEPLCVLQDVFVRPGETRDDRMLPLDLSQALFRFRLRAVDAGGRRVPLDSPILARMRKQDGSTAEAGFRFQKGLAELVATTSMLDLVVFAPGCAVQKLTLGPGEHDVFMQRLQPALVELPGARALCGPQRRVRVSAILEGDTGLPQSLGGLDQRTGDRFNFARWDLGKSHGAWLGVSDTVEIPLMQGGRYQILLRPHATDSESSPQASIPLGIFELRVDGSSFMPVRVPLDAAAVTQALTALDQQAQARQR